MVVVTCLKGLKKLIMALLIQYFKYFQVISHLPINNIWAAV